MNAAGNACVNGDATGFIVDGDCACDCALNYEGDACESKTPCDTCVNGGTASGYYADDNCACDCTAIDYEGDSCETKTACTVNGGGVACVPTPSSPH